jgi:hypothetical protein
LSVDKFLKLLFDPGQNTCFADNPKGTSVKSAPDKQDYFFCINALHPTEDLAPSMPYHAIDKPRRADANVVCFRNFLIELDNMALKDQISYVTRKLPVTSITYSGGKSYHFIVSLEQPLEDYEAYCEYVERLVKYIPEMDRACRNPSRLSRLANAIRPENGKVQELKYLGERIRNTVFDSLLPAKPEYDKFNKMVQPSFTGRRFVQHDVMDAVSYPQKMLARLGGRNAYFFWLGNRLREVPNWDEAFVLKYVNTAYGKLENTSGFSEREAYTAARIQV